MDDFYFTGDDYRYRFEAEAKQRFIEILHQRFNAGVKYKGRVLKWDTVIQEKTGELGRYLVGRSRRLDLSEPAPILERRDNRAVREMILSLTQLEARRRGIGKSTFYDLQDRAKSNRPFTVYGSVLQRLSE